MLKSKSIAYFYCSFYYSFLLFLLYFYTHYTSPLIHIIRLPLYTLYVSPYTHYMSPLIHIIRLPLYTLYVSPYTHYIVFQTPFATGNIYVMFKKEEDAAKCVEELNNRWYNGRPIYAELSPVTGWFYLVTVEL